MPLPGLGKLKPAERAARTGRNPATGLAMEIPAKRLVKFAEAKALSDSLNN
ncbi:DNA-binding protein HU [compost metagenome]